MSRGGWPVLQAAVAALEEPLKRFVVPIYARTTSGVTAVGTAVLLHAEQRHLLITAGHVLDQRKAAPLVVWSGPTEQFVPIAGEAIVTPCEPFRREGDRLDIAVVTLGTETVEGLKGSDSAFADAEILDEKERKEGIYAFAGYPVGPNEPMNRGDGVRVVQRVLHVVHVSEVSPRGYRRANCSPETHFVASYDRNRLLSSAGTVTALPRPIGMSGGGLFFLGRLEEVVSRRARARLTGVGIEHLEKKRMIVASGVPVLAYGLLQALSRPVDQREPGAGKVIEL